MEPLTLDKQNQLVLQHIGLYKSIARKIAIAFNRLHDLEEIEGVAMLACVEASRKFNDNLGNKFSTYATTYIKNQCSYYLIDNQPKQGTTFTDSKIDPSLVGQKSVADDSDESDNLDTDSLPLANNSERAITAEQDEILSMVPAPLREICTLYILGNTFEQIAVQLDKPVHVVKLVVRNGKNALTFAGSPGLFSEIGSGDTA